MITRMGIGVGLIAGALGAGAGIAAAAPDVEAIANMSCTYPQVEAALNAQSPDAANELRASPLATWWVQNLVGSAPDQRRAMITQVQGLPEVQRYEGAINLVAQSCHNF